MTSTEGLEERLAEFEAQTVFNVVNVSVAASLVAALIGRMHRSGMIGPRGFTSKMNIVHRLANQVVVTRSSSRGNV